MKDFPIVFLLCICIALYWLSWLFIIIAPFYVVYKIIENKKLDKLLKEIKDEE